MKTTYDENIYMVPPDVDSVMGVLDTFIRWRAKNNKDRKYSKYHPSSFGHCLRLMQYQRYAEEGFIKVQDDDFDSTKLRLFDKGHNMHGRWAKYFEQIGVLRGNWECTNPACKIFPDCSDGFSTIDKFVERSSSSPRIFGTDNVLGCFKPEKCECGNKNFRYKELMVRNDEMNISGHCDMVLDFSKFDENQFNGVKKSFNFKDLPKGPVVVDMKTVNDYGFKQLVQKGPSLEYRIQLVIYSNVLNVDFGILIYENKNSSAVASYKIDKDTDTIFEQVKKQAKTMNEMYSLKLLPPPRALAKDDYECSNCPFKSTCHASKIWDDPELNNKRKNFYGNLL